jgi:RNA polymerase sigma-70 factor (ECF subfamily)
VAYQDRHLRSVCPTEEQKTDFGFDDYLEQLMATSDRSPEERTFDSEMRSLLEIAVDSLQDEYRSVLIMRDVEGMSTSETADCLEISEENVKVRLFRARAAIRRQLFEYVGAASPRAFPVPGRALRSNRESGSRTHQRSTIAP